MRSKTPTVEEYLRSLPEDRRAAISAVREVILKNLDSSYEEGILYGMIGYYVPHSAYPKGYPCDPKQPLPFAVLGSKKNYMTLHLMAIYAGGAGSLGNAQWFRDEWAKTGRKMDVGQACIRFKNADDLPLKLIGKAIKLLPAKKWIAVCEAAQTAEKKRA
jgi:Domain of unknown function (DU1801)